MKYLVLTLVCVIMVINRSPFDWISLKKQVLVILRQAVCRFSCLIHTNLAKPSR